MLLVAQAAAAQVKLLLMRRRLLAQQTLVAAAAAQVKIYLLEPLAVQVLSSFVIPTLLQFLTPAAGLHLPLQQLALIKSPP
jgi:hypothetical protein